MRRALVCVTAAVGLLALVGTALAQGPGDKLEEDFKNPPDSAKPRVWWHWMNGNITKEGIKLDLEWMKRVGIGGFQNFDAALSTPVHGYRFLPDESWRAPNRVTAFSGTSAGPSPT